MNRSMYAGIFLASLWMGCGAESTPGGGTPDAGMAASVTEVACADVPTAMTITTTAAGDAFTPATMTITAGTALKFVMPPNHNVASTSPGLAVDFGATKCLRFAAAGNFDYRCAAHSFTGRVTVQ